MHLESLKHRLATAACQIIPILKDHEVVLSKSINANLGNVNATHDEITSEFLMQTLAGRNLLERYF